MSATPSLVINRRLKAPRAKVFQAWTDPQTLMRWWGPEWGKTVSADIDARVGGRFEIAYRNNDGVQIDVSGVYREIVPDEKLVFTWAWRSTPERESLVTVTLKSEDDGTLLTLTHEQFFDEAARDRHHEGWDSALDKLVRLFD